MHEYMRWCSILNKEVREGITEKEPFKQGPKGQHGSKPYFQAERTARRPIKEANMSKSE